ncbi:hypothetical protein M2405_004171 [Rhodococcus erythropolis]|uniref:hypothetical protein n=1 Tax=Rhodococcus erythropolis TaxID=1833 RepID=UPI002167047E|nr:hypothetical protein [Rhodococcus erythropolis]MCS4255868.1 hypothetical protein [Rhodococcus erythropolis]MCW2425385.1 hypothetical protein [Rhodococcus erythropolis]
MYVFGSDFGARWDVRFTFEPSPELQEVLLTVIARISRDTLRFDGMREFDPGVWRVDIRRDVFPVPGLVLSLGVNNQDGSGFGISSGLDTLAATLQIAHNFQDFDEWLQWPTLPGGGHLDPGIVDGEATWMLRGEVVAPIGQLTEYLDRLDQ